MKIFQALTGTTVNAPTIDGRAIPLELTEIIKPTTVRRVPNEGLPHPKQPSKRGELLVEFDIQFPDSLPSSAREKIAGLLPS